VIKKAIAIGLLAMGVTAFLVLAYAMGEKNMAAQTVVWDASCGECHACSTPTTETPCLRQCPRLSSTVVAHSLDEAPSVVVLDQLSDQYVPVVFPHKLHAQMSGMGDGCAVCHHYSPAGHIPPCRDCHGGPSNPQNLEQPSLKGAYHRHCLNCHREWSHDTECVVCHAKKTSDATPVTKVDKTDIMGRLHPNITEPDKKVYQTDYNGGTVVTFRHREHIHLFGLKCVDCHREESCSRCHDVQKEQQLVKSVEEHHKPCSSCHDMNTCSGCHTKKEAPSFTHARTGWPLNRYHSSLECQACHPSGHRIGKLNRDCVACHGNWATGTFDHAVTGLALDEVHSATDCADCHVDRKFEQKPSCSTCHDDGRTYPQSSPGTPAGDKT
jgi:hypothetical protein